MEDNLKSAEISNFIRSRRSTRDFLPTQVPPEIINQILVDALSAPSWSNRTQYLGVLLSGGSTTQVPTSNGFIGVLLSNGSTTTQVPIS
jgi:hypothetical protein